MTPWAWLIRRINEAIDNALDAIVRRTDDLIARSNERERDW